MPSIERITLHDEAQESDLTIEGGGIKDSGTSKTILTAKIDSAAGGDIAVVAADANYKIKVVTITFTVAGETNITLKHAATAYTGAMDFGGTTEPKGWTMNWWPFPLETALNEAFNVNSSAAVQVSGLIQYYKEA